MAAFAFRFSEEKAADAAAEVIRLEGGHPDMIRVVKLLYLADRKSLERRDRPITGDSFCSMRNGLVVSRIYDLLKPDNPFRGKAWDRRIRREHNTLAVVDPDGFLALSQEDLDIIAEVVMEHRDKGTWELCEWTHDLPEWENPGASSLPVQIESLLAHLGKTPEQVEEIVSRETGLADFHRAIGLA